MLFGVGFPHAVCSLRGPREDSPFYGVEIEGAVDDPRVSSRGVYRDVLFLFKYCDSTVVLVSYPVGDGCPQDSAAYDNNIPGFHSNRLFFTPVQLLCQNWRLDL